MGAAACGARARAAVSLCSQSRTLGRAGMLPEGCCGTGGEGQSAAGQSVSAGAQGSCRAASSRVAVLCTLRPVPGTQVLIWLLGHERDCKDAHVCWFWRGHRAELGRADLAGPWHGADSLMFTDI